MDGFYEREVSDSALQRQAIEARMREEARYAAVERWCNLEDEIFIDEWDEAMRAKEGEYQYFSVIKAHKIKKVWQEFADTSQVYDTKAIDHMEDIMLRNTVKLRINTIISGHTPTNGEQWASDKLGREVTEEDTDKYWEYCFNPKQGQYNISDYGLDKLEALLIELMVTTSYEEKLVYIDRMLNVIHMRSDLASYFIEGGRYTLNELAQVRPEEG